MCNWQFFVKKIIETLKLCAKRLSAINNYLSVAKCQNAVGNIRKKCVFEQQIDWFHLWLCTFNIHR
jgi:hypothetical protein